MPQQPVANVLLAAGRGSRFGATGVANELLTPLPDGTPIAVQAARHLMQALSDVVAVVPIAATHGAQVDQLAALLAETGCEVLHCPNVVHGMGASLAAGVAARPQVGGWVITLADMPWTAPETITQATNAVDPHDCVALFHTSQRGYPIGFGTDFFAGLIALNGDEDVRRLIDPAKLISIETDDTSILRDVDTPADLAR